MRDAQPILDLIDAFRCSKVMFAAVTLGIFDRLEQGPAGARQLAEEKHCDTGALERLLDACVALGLLRRVDGFLPEPLPRALEKREDRAARLRELDEVVSASPMANSLIKRFKQAYSIPAVA